MQYMHIFNTAFFLCPRSDVSLAGLIRIGLFKMSCLSFSTPNKHFLCFSAICFMDNYENYADSQRNQCF